MWLKHFKISRPPLRLVAVVTGMLLASLQGWIRLGLSLSNWNLYQSLGVVPGVWYLAVSGLFSGSVYLACTVLTLLPNYTFRKPASLLLLTGLAGFWIDRIFIAISPESRTALPFFLISSAGLTIAAVVILNWDTIFRHNVKQEK